MYGNDFTSSDFGRAHSALHWEDIRTFKTMGIEQYDFCGWYSGKEDKELLNNNKLKEQFTTNVVKEYSGVIYKSIFIKLFKAIKK